MASGPITSWQIDGETMKTMTDSILLGSKITADGDCSHEIKRHLLLGRKAMRNLDSMLWSYIWSKLMLFAILHSFKSSLFQRSGDLCAMGITVASSPGSSDKSVKWLTNCFLIWKMAGGDLQWTHRGMSRARRLLMWQSFGWKEGSFSIILEVKEREKVWVLECWAQHHLPNEKAQVIKILSH